MKMERGRERIQADVNYESITVSMFQAGKSISCITKCESLNSEYLLHKNLENNHEGIEDAVFPSP